MRGVHIGGLTLGLRLGSMMIILDIIKIDAWDDRTNVRDQFWLRIESQANVDFSINGRSIATKILNYRALLTRSQRNNKYSASSCLNFKFFEVEIFFKPWGVCFGFTIFRLCSR